MPGLRVSTSSRSPTTTPPKGGRRPTRPPSGSASPSCTGSRSRPGSTARASTCWGTSSILAHKPVAEALRRILDGRDDRMPKIVERLTIQGIDITEDEFRHKRAQRQGVERPHIADVLVDKSVVKDRGEAFIRFRCRAVPDTSRSTPLTCPTATPGQGRRRQDRDRPPVRSRGSDRVLTRRPASRSWPRRGSTASRSTTDHDSEARAPACGRSPARCWARPDRGRRLSPGPARARSSSAATPRRRTSTTA